MENTLPARFFKTESGNEPVREWLKELPAQDRKTIGEDIRTVQIGWPLGMPLVDHIEGDIWEVRSKLGNRIARVLFALADGELILLHGFIKKTNKTPDQDKDLAKQRLKATRRAK